jgi:hypothetical protein
MSNQLEIRLFSKEDKNGDEYFIGSTDIPAMVNLADVTFVFFLPPEGEAKGVLKIRSRQQRTAPPDDGHPS